jgi:hypothetical protein
VTIDEAQSLSLVILGPNTPHAGKGVGQTLAADAVTETLTRCRASQRRFRNTLVFVAPDEPAVVSRLEATTNHRLREVEHPAAAARFNSVGRLTRLEELRGDHASGKGIVAAMLQPPLRNDRFDIGFGTLYTAEYQPAAGTAMWHWPAASWTRRFDDPDGVRTVSLDPRPGS